MNVDEERLRLRCLRAERALEQLLLVLSENAADLPSPVLNVADAVARSHARPGRVTAPEIAALKYQQREM